MQKTSRVVGKHAIGDGKDERLVEGRTSTSWLTPSTPLWRMIDNLKFRVEPRADDSNQILISSINIFATSALP